MVFLVLSNICVGTVVGVNEAEMPEYSVGDKWKFSVDYKGEIEMIGTGTLEITGDSVNITQFGKNYVCYECSITESDTVYGGGINGTYTENRKLYAQKLDLSEVKHTLTTNMTLTYAGETHTTKQVITITYDPPLDSGGFPLTVGKSWSATTTETTTTQTTIDGKVDQETNTTTYTKSYVVLGTELTTVSAGEFDTFVINATDPDGSYFVYYYSPKASFNVKEMVYDENGTLVYTAELLEYSYAAADDENGAADDAAEDGDLAEEGFPLWIIIGVIIAVAAVTSGVGYVLYKRRKTTASVASPTPPTEKQPQPTTSPY